MFGQTHLSHLPGVDQTAGSARVGLKAAGTLIWT